MCRVLLVTHYFPDHRAGVEIAAGHLADALSDRGCHVTWAASCNNERTSEYIPRHPIRRVPIRHWNVVERVFGFSFPLWGPAGFRRLVRAVRECDVVHLHEYLYLGNIVAFVAAKLLGKPVVITQHASSIPYKNVVLRTLLAAANRFLGGLLLGRATRCFFISAKAQDYFGKIVQFRRPPTFVPNGVDTSVFHPVPAEERSRLRRSLGYGDGDFVALFVGRFVELKRLDLMRSLAAELPNVRWVFVGDGPDRPDAWGLPNVNYLGSLPQREIARLYQAADLFVLPSEGEGFPLVIQESMACGTPALMTHDTAKGAPGVDAVSLTADANLESLEHQVRSATTDAGRLAILRQAVANYAAQHWSWRECAQQYADVFHSMAPQSTYRKAA